MPTIVVHPCDETSLRGVTEAAEAGIIVPVLVGPAAKIAATAQRHGIDISGFDIIDAPHSHAAAEKAVELIRAGKGELLMKGSLHTDELMQAVTSGATGLRTERRISHVFVMLFRPMPRRCSSLTRPSIFFLISMPSGTSCRTQSIYSRRPAWERPG